MATPPKIQPSASTAWSAQTTDDGQAPYPLPGVCYQLTLERVVQRKSQNKKNPKTFGRTFWMAEWRIAQSNADDPAHQPGLNVITIAFDAQEFQQRDFGRGLAAAWHDLYGEAVPEWSGGHMAFAVGPVVEEAGRPTGAPDGTALRGGKVTLITGSRTSQQGGTFTTYRFMPGHTAQRANVVRQPPPQPAKKVGQHYDEAGKRWVDYDTGMYYPDGGSEWLPLEA